MTNIFQLFKQILITSRPFGWLIFGISYLGGFLISKSFSSWDLQNTVTLFSVTAILSFPIYAINDIYDFESDKVNERKKVAILGKIMGGILESKYWKLFKILSLIYIFITIITPIIFGNFLGLACVILGLIIGIGYSLPPFRFKTRPFGDILACTLGFMTLFILGMSKDLDLDKFMLSFPYVIFSSIMVLSWSTLCLGIDYKTDKIANHKTTSTRLNRNLTFLLASFGYFICSLILMFYFSSFWSILLFLSSFIILFGLKYKSTNFDIFVLILVTSLSILAYSSIFIKFL